MNNKKTIIILILILFIGIGGLTLAYFANSTSVDNLFTTQPYGTTVIEEFTSPSNWLPGDTTYKVLTATNTGKVDQAVRIKLTEVWTPSNSNSTLNGWIHADGTKSTHTTESELANDERVAIINFDNLSDWTYSDGYYYYNHKLAPNETTSSLIKSVTFNPNTKLDDTCISTTNGSTRTITCNSSGDDYDNATYTLTFNIETVQYNKYNETWNLNNAVAISETKQRMLKGLKVNVTDATFDNGDKTAMFEFSHPATAQTPALTDYRYIGHIPNNYVKFNCDNDGTNCEIWRIIGVFSVDDGKGNWEQRIKLVRGSALPDAIAWDTNSTNEWTTASLELFLNGDYLTRQGDTSDYGLKELTRSQIDDAKYYLGGKPYSTTNTSELHSAESIYNWERGVEVYNYENYCLSHLDDYTCASDYCENNPASYACAERQVYWNGKISHLYPSDMYMTYANGVDDGCFNDAGRCLYRDAIVSTGGVTEGIFNYPESGWIYNSSRFEGYYVHYFFSPSFYWSQYVFYLNNSGYFAEMGGGPGNVVVPGIIRPTVYLKSSINIISGEGTEQDPYVLG